MTQFKIIQTLTMQGLMLAFVLVTGTTDFLFLNFAANSPETPETSHHSEALKERNELRLSPASTGKRVVPFGVFDVQSGHGHGQWREKPENLLR